MSLHQLVVMKYNSLVQLTQADTVSVVQIVIEAVIQQNQLRTAMLVSTNKDCQQTSNDL